MLPTASHTISTLTENVPISDQEAGVWTTLMKKTIEAKLKMTKALTRVLTLKKLLRKGIGTDCVEKFTRRECSDGVEERVKILKRIMRIKVKDAEVQVEGARKEFKKKMSYIERRWGQNVAILARMKEVMQMEVRRTWEEGRTKVKKKVNFLERKWKRVRQDLDPNVKEWRGIRYGDRYLQRRRAEGGRDLNDVPLVYGRVYQNV